MTARAALGYDELRPLTAPGARPARCGQPTHFDTGTVGHEVLELSAGEAWPLETLVVIPCSAAKLDRPAPAGELYRSSQFALGLGAARALTGDGWIRVLSARHGLVALGDQLAPYDTRWGDPDAVSASTIRAQAARIRAEVVIALTPRAYTEALAEAWPDLIAPLAGSAGIGEQRHRLRLIRDTSCGQEARSAVGPLRRSAPGRGGGHTAVHHHDNDNRLIRRNP